MKKIMLILVAWIGFFANLQADWLDEVKAIHAEVRALTSNAEGLGDEQRLERFYTLSYDLAMLESPGFATYKGDPRGQDRLGDLSPAGIERRQQGERDALAFLDSIDRNALSELQRDNYDLLRDNLQREVGSQRFPTHFMQMTQMSGPQQNLARLMAMMPNAKPEQLENQIARMEALPKYVDESIALLSAGMNKGVTPPAITLRDVPQQIRGQLVDDASKSPLLKGFLDIPATVDPLQADSLRKRAEQVYREQVVPAYEKLLEFTENQYLPGARQTIAARDLPDGEAWYQNNVALMTTTDLTPQQIHDIGLREVKRIRGEMDAVIESTGFAGSFEDFLYFLRTDPQFYHTTAEGLMREYRDIAKRADPELTKLFGILPRTPYGVIEVPDYAAKSTTTAYYQPGSLKAGRPGYYFANTYALDTRPRWEMEALSLHEAVPGHHLQIAIQQELEGLPWFRQTPSYTAFVEGWGLYSESLGEEMGFYKDPYSRFGQLTYEMWRAIRLVVDTGMHYLGWSRQQAIDFFKENAGKSEHDIVVEVDRYIVWPGQALAYKIGELKIKELRAYAEEQLGDQFDIRAFHDEVLGRGAIPLSVLDANIKSWVRDQM
ncbi:MAG: DUF885 domain-containing protein [Xanthomonadales bacterium]|jgi:uncharacterized protein (DUF885 family)|nr:DUF885 domain-containing protein [Xanthomonadales bacterium]MDH4002148.1 DUF885 domain-containing protein [Xanthomonadales bacterium]